MMPPNPPSASGHAAMHAFLATDIATMKAAGQTLVDRESRTGVSGNLGWHSGTFKVTNASGATVDTGNYSETWRRTDGKCSSRKIRSIGSSIVRMSWWPN